MALYISFKQPRAKTCQQNCQSVVFQKSCHRLNLSARVFRSSCSAERRDPILHH